MTATDVHIPDMSDDAASAAIPSQPSRRGLRDRVRRPTPDPGSGQGASRQTTIADAPFDIAPNDPILAFFQSASGAVDVTTLELESAALEEMRAAGIVLVVPLVTSGELIGLLNLGARLSERGYSSDDKQLLGTLAGYAAPAMRVGQLVRQQENEARQRERIEQELKVAQLIQQQFLPKTLPDLPTWNLAAFYRPARTVGGDFYDFLELPDGRVLVVVGDVTDKGVPAALVMASTHALLRSEAPRLLSPGQILAAVNDLLCVDIPAHMFVNAGHNLPYLRGADGVTELRATGMPFGLMPGMSYEESSAVMYPGDSLLLHSDGLAEAHDSKREMFGFPRLAEIASRPLSGERLIDACMSELENFTGPGVEQEDDITLVVLDRRPGAAYVAGSS